MFRERKSHHRIFIVRRIVSFTSKSSICSLRLLSSDSEVFYDWWNATQSLKGVCVCVIRVYAFWRWLKRPRRLDAYLFLFCFFNVPIPASFPFHQLTVNIFNINFVEYRIRTADLLSQKQPLCHLSHNRCPSSSLSFLCHHSIFSVWFCLSMFFCFVFLFCCAFAVILCLFFSFCVCMEWQIIVNKHYSFKSLLSFNTTSDPLLWPILSTALRS